MPRRPGSSRTRRIAACVAILAGGLLSGCLMPNAGTPVYVDAFAGDFWSGEGQLLEVSADRQRCKVAVRDRALVVRTRWIACKSVHPRG